MSKIHVFLKRWLVPVCFVFWIFQLQLQMTGLGSFLRIPTYLIYKAAQYAVPALLLVQILFFQSHSRKQLAVWSLVTAVFTVSAWQAGPWDLLMIWLFMAAVRDQDADRLVRAGYCALLCALIFILASFFLGRLDDVTDFRRFLNMPRHSWGYCNANILGVVLFQLAACRLYLHRNCLGPEDLIVTGGAMVFVYVVPNSLSAVACIALLLALTLVCMVWPLLPEKPRKLVLGCFIPAAVFCNLFSVAASLCYRPGGPLETLDKLLTVRLSSSNTIYSIFGISLFGRHLPPMFTQAEYNGISFWMPWLDSSYMILLIRYGLIAYLVYSALYFLGMRRVQKTGNVMLLGILTIIAVHAVMEPTLFDLRYCFLPIVMFAALPSPEKSEIASHNFTGT